MNRNNFNKNELLKYIYSSNKTINEIVDGLKFALLPNITTDTLNAQNIKYEKDVDGVTNIIINPLQYPNITESLKIPNLTEWVEKHLTDSIISFKKVVVPSNYNDIASTSLSDGLIFNPTDKTIDKIAMRGTTTIFNYKNKDEQNKDYNIIFEGTNNNSTFLTVTANNLFPIDYNSIKRNLLNPDNKLEFKTQHTNYINDKIFESYKNKVPIVELDGGLLSLPYGISLSSNNDNYTIRKSFNDIIHKSTRAISFYFGENYFGDDILNNNIKYNDSSIDINGKRILILNAQNGDTLKNPILTNVELNDNILYDNLLINNNLKENYFQTLQWYGNNITNRMLIGDNNNPFVKIIGKQNNIILDSNGFIINNGKYTNIELSYRAILFGINAYKDETYFGTATYFNKPTFIHNNLHVSNTESIFKGKISIENDLYIKESLFLENTGYFNGGLIVHKEGYFLKNFKVGSGIIELSNTELTINSDINTIINSRVIKCNSSDYFGIYTPETRISSNMKIFSEKIDLSTDNTNKALYIDKDGYLTTSPTTT